MKVEDALTELQNSDDTHVKISFEIKFAWKNRFTVLSVLKRIFRSAEVNCVSWKLNGHDSSMELKTDEIFVTEKE